MSNNRRHNTRKIFGNILWIMLGLATVVLLGAAISLRNHRKCSGVNIQVMGGQDNLFIDKTEIGGLLESLCGGAPAGKTLGSFNLSLIENTLMKNRWIKKAEIFFDNNDLLRVDVTEREPVARIFTRAGNSFYLDTTLTRLPLSDKISARVPVFSNYPSLPAAADSALLAGIKDIGSYILHDPFWMAQVEQVDITGDQQFEMVPKIGNQLIVFGTAENYDEKFRNLLTFYRQVGTKVGWNTYSKINLRFKGQVVAVKRGAEDIIQDLLQTKQLMESIAANAQKQSAESAKNIQLDQQQDDNIVPLAPQLDDIPDEQPITRPVAVQDSSKAKTISPSNERPDPALTPPTTVVTKPVSTKRSGPRDKPFWLKAATPKPVLKKTYPKRISTSNGKPNPIPKKILQKAPVKTVIKPIIKPKTKPRAVLPPKNDY